MRAKITFLTIACLFSLLVAGQGYTVTASGPDMNITRYGHLAFLVDQDRAIVIGGHTTGFALTNTADIYDHNSNTWTLRTLPHSHDGAAVAYIDNGKYLIMGGCGSNSGVGRNAYTTIFDAVNDTFYSGPDMITSRTNNASARLANDKILVVGNWYTSNSTPELYDPATNSFSATGAMITPRSHPMALPTNDGNAYVFGGFDLYGNGPLFTIEEYNVNTNTFSLVDTTLIPNETGWRAAWYPNMGVMHDNRLSDGRYVFMIYKTVGSTNQYRLMTFNPSTKTFAVLATNPQIPDYTANQAGKWAYAWNISVDEYLDYIYIDAVDLQSGNNEHKLFAIDASTGDLAIPMTYATYGHLIYTASKFVVPGGEIAYLGGSIDGGNFNVSDDYTLIEPEPSFGITEVGRDGGWFYAYPNPANNNAFKLVIPDVESPEIEIYDLTGKLILTLPTSEEQREIVVERGEMKPGIYLVILSYKGGRSATRLILN
jgi:hypothetical protein